MSIEIGQVIGQRYRVEAFLGKGGMAEVYQVWDLQRAVYLALKLLNEDLAEDKVFLRRFQREGQTLSLLQHPCIVRFYGLEKTGDSAFMLMDYIEGVTLRKEISRSDGPIELDRAFDIIKPVCSALYYAHNQGMIHCDVKPANIMLHRNGSVLLADFGIARMTETATTTTLVGAGTPAYMAPEQVKGLDPLPQTDIYSLGIVLYEMLTAGERPFTGERATTTGTTMEKVRWEQVNVRPEPPRTYNRALPPAVENVILRCLEKDPTRRFNNALDLLNAYQSALSETSDPASEKQAPPPNFGRGTPFPPIEPPPAPSKTAVPPDPSSPAIPVFNQPVRESAPQKKRSSGLVWAGLAGLVIVVMLFAIFGRPAFNGPNAFSTPPAAAAAPTQPEPTAVPTQRLPTAAPSATPDFLPGRVESTTAGISLHYPATWLANKNDGSAASVSIVISTHDPSKLQQIPDNFAALIVYSVYVDPGNMGGIPEGLDISSPRKVMQFLRDHPDQASGVLPAGAQYNSDIRDTTLGNADAAVEEITLKAGLLNSESPEMLGVYYCVRPKDRLVFLIGLSRPQDWEKYSPVIAQVTASIQFTPVVLATATPLGPVPAPTAVNPVSAPTAAAPTPGSGQIPALVGTKTYRSAPPMMIDVKKQYTATVKMVKGGEFIIQLFPDRAPFTVNSFVFLARQGFFEGVTFHRVLEGFMAQGGDPSGAGMGGPGYQFVSEDNDLEFDKPGVVAMANAGRDTNGSQFFITFTATPQLNGGYTIFGQVASGMDVVNAIKRRDPATNPNFQGDAIASVTITEK